MVDMRLEDKVEFWKKISIKSNGRDYLHLEQGEYFQ